MTVGLSRAGFDKDLAVGEEREDAFAKVVKHAKVEHKRDFGYVRTGNIYIEYAQESKFTGELVDSGILVTTADYWAIEYLENQWILIETTKLKTIAERIMTQFPKRCVKGGDWDKTRGVLLRLEDLA